MDTVNAITWLLIADASKARLFSLHKAKLFHEVNPDILKKVREFTHAESRKKEAELITDKMGEFGSSTFGEANSAKEHEATVFAQELIQELEQGRVKNAFRDIILVAPPAFMGLLNKNMPSTVSELVSQRIEKDYTQQNGQELVSHLASHF